MKEQETFRRFTSKIQPRSVQDKRTVVTGTIIDVIMSVYDSLVSLVLSKGNSLPPCGGGEHDIVSVLRRDEDVRHRL